MSAIAAERPPAKRLGDDPLVDSLESLGVALQELSYLTTRQKAVKASCDAAIRKEKTAAEKSLRTTVAGVSVSYADRIKALNEAISEFCEANRELVLADSGKTRTLTHGTIGWKKQPLKIEFTDDGDQVALMELVDEQVPTDDATLVEFLIRQLKRIKVTEKLTAHDLLDVKVTLSKAALIERFKTKSLSDEDLEEVGLAAVQSEKLNVRVHEYSVESETA